MYSDLPPDALKAIHEAALILTSELSPTLVLERIVQSARTLVRAEYAALGIPDPIDMHLIQFITVGISDEQRQRMGALPIGKGILGELLKPDARTIRIRNIAEHPRSVGFPPHHPIMKAFLGVPIRSRNQLLGSLYLTDKLDAPEFSQQDETIIETLASFAAIAIENARLYQQVQHVAVLEERERIGMDLHDGVIQSIYAVGLLLENSAFEIESAPQDSQKHIQQAIEGLNTTIKDIRNYIHNLRPTRFIDIDLYRAMTTLLNEFRKNTLADAILYYDDRIGDTLSEETARVAYHITQEAIANVAKHAAATRLEINTHLENGSLIVTIFDNGIGFVAQHPHAERSGYGLSNIEARARSIGGIAIVQSEPGRGTTVTVHLPTSGLPQPEKHS